MPEITVQGPQGPPVAYAFDQDAITVGRAADSDIVVRDAAVSRLHLSLRRDGRAWRLRDEGSRHGTSVNGEPLASDRVLRPGDTITLGHTTLVFAKAVEGAVADGEDLPTGPLPRWSGRGTGRGDTAPAIVGRSPALLEILATVDAVAPSSATVLLLGENGTGKELVARRIHDRSPRAPRPFVVVNCPALPSSLLEAELFGVEKGVATGVEPRVGRVEMAEGGTLFLDEVGDLEPAAQAKILRLVADGSYERIGGREVRRLDARLVAATNHDLAADADLGSFRRDLYHRLDTVTIRLPPLRERTEDIPSLVEHFVAQGSAAPRPFGPEALEALAAYDFPGNVRELEHVVERALLLSKGAIIGVEDLPPHVRRPSRGGEPCASSVDELRDRITRDGESFWDAFAAAYLRRTLSREDARRFIEAEHAAAGGSYLELARRLGIEGDYRKLLNFLHYHDLRVGR